MIKLHLGSGSSAYGVVQGIDGPPYGGSAMDWVNVDANFDPELLTRPHASELVHGFPRMLQCDFRKLPFPDNFADACYSHHALEHVRVDDTLPTLKEWHRVLKPGGICGVVVPDLLWVAQQICRTNGDLLWSEMGEITGDWGNGYTKLIYCIFGDQSDDTYQLHRTGFTGTYLSSLFEQAGFLSIQADRVADMGMRPLVIEGRK